MSVKKVILLCGGASSERAISKSSSKGIYNALLANGYNVTPVDPAYGSLQPADAEEFFGKEDLFPVSFKNYIDAVKLPVFDDADLVFLGLHGRYGEDGIIQSLLELRGVKYTGSGVLSSALSWDKAYSKMVFNDKGVQTAPGFSSNKKMYPLPVIIEKIKGTIGFPAIVKPNDEGSTFGFSLINNESEVADAVENAYKYSENALFEKFIPGREITVGILNGMVLPVLEIRPIHEIYDYECKYTSGMSEYLVPAPIPDDVALKVQEQAIKAFYSLGCKTYARIDFRLDPDFESYCLEINTLPGMTPTSLLPKMAAVVGISYEELVKRIVEAS